jgi:hypothetical protein
LVSCLFFNDESLLTVPGLESSRMTEGDEAQAIWSMAFEASDAAALEREHRRMVEQYYGPTL